VSDEADPVKKLLHRELRAAYSAKVERGADPDEVTADLTERIRRVRALRPGQDGSAPPRDEAPDAE